MYPFKSLLSRLQGLFRKEQFDRELDEELEFLVDRETEENLQRGMALSEARRQARIKVGGLEQIKLECRDARGIPTLEDSLRELRFTLRRLFKNPGFTAAALLTLALGIGANTAAFSVVNTVLLRRLPFPSSDQLLQLTQADTPTALSIPEYEFFKEHNRSFSSMAGYRGGGARLLVSESSSRRIQTLEVTREFLRTLGVTPFLGREFNSRETHPELPGSIILSDGLWRSTYGANRQIIGHSVKVDDKMYTVVGVLPSDFWFPWTVDALLPLKPTASLRDTGTNTAVIARLKPAVSLRQAQEEMAALSRRFRAGHGSEQRRRLTVLRFQDVLVRDIRANLLLLFGITGLLLLITCSNLVSFLLTRLTFRRRELALRLALGSSRRQLLGQFLVENLLLTIPGALLGILCARGLLAVLVALIPFRLPASEPVQLNSTVLLFALSVTLAASLLFTLTSFLTVPHLDVASALKTSGKGSADVKTGRGLHKVLVVAKVAMSTVLLINAMVLIQSLRFLQDQHLGFNPQDRMTFQTPIAPNHRRTFAESVRYVEAIRQRIQALTNLPLVAGINLLPLAGKSNLPTQRAGYPDQSIGGMEVRLVTPGYFEVMEIPVLRGRSFTEADTGGSVPVALVNQALARRWWKTGGAVGDALIIGRYHDQIFREIEDSQRTVVGVVADTKTVSITDAPRPTVFIPVAQARPGVAPRQMTWILAGGAGMPNSESIRQAIGEVDPEQPVQRFRTLNDIVNSRTADPRFNAWLFGAFAFIALSLATIGVHAVLSFSMAQRTQEIGIRMALGADRYNVLALVLRQGLGLAFLGLVLGLLGATWLTHLLSGLLFGIGPRDPESFGVAALLILLTAAAAVYLPARRAAQIQPVDALRAE